MKEEKGYSCYSDDLCKTTKELSGQKRNPDQPVRYENEDDRGDDDDDNDDDDGDDS